MTSQEKFHLGRNIRPVHLMTTIVMYLLGAGLAHYLGEQINYSTFLLGIVWMICLQLGFYFLGDHFQTPFDSGLFSHPADQTHEPGLQPGQSPDLLLFSSLSLLAAAAVLGVILGVGGNLTLASGVVMGLFFGLFLLIVVPGFSLDLSGVGEFISSIILVVLPPALAFLLQSDRVHLFLSLGVFPLFPLHLGMIFTLRLKRYRMDLYKKRKTLLVRIGWIQAVFIHNLLIMAGFLLFGVSVLFGMPFKIIGPVFLTLPAAVYLIWTLSRLKEGAPVRWPIITLLSLVVFFLPTYLLTFSVWIN